MSVVTCGCSYGPSTSQPARGMAAQQRSSVCLREIRCFGSCAFNTRSSTGYSNDARTCAYPQVSQPLGSRLPDSSACTYRTPRRHQHSSRNRKPAAACLATVRISTRLPDPAYSRQWASQSSPQCTSQPFTAQRAALSVPPCRRVQSDYLHTQAVPNRRRHALHVCCVSPSAALGGPSEPSDSAEHVQPRSFLASILSALSRCVAHATGGFGQSTLSPHWGTFSLLLESRDHQLPCATAQLPACRS